MTRWHWPSGLPTRSVWRTRCSGIRCFTSIAASQNWHCNGSRRSKRSLPSNEISFLIAPQFLRGAALTAQGAFEEAVACLHEGLASPIGTLWRCYGLAALADVLTRQGERRAALSAARDGLNTA